MSKRQYTNDRAMQFPLRMSPQLHARITSHAKSNSRSINTEIIHTLEAAYPAPVEPESINDALLQAATNILDDWSRTLTAIGQDPTSNPRVAALIAAVERAKSQGERYV